MRISRKGYEYEKAWRDSERRMKKDKKASKNKEDYFEDDDKVYESGYHYKKRSNDGLKKSIPIGVITGGALGTGVGIGASRLGGKNKTLGLCLGIPVGLASGIYAGGQVQKKHMEKSRKSLEKYVHPKVSHDDPIFDSWENTNNVI